MVKLISGVKLIFEIKMSSMSDLNWDLYPNLVRIDTMGDGSCFFHAILQCVFDRYKTSGPMDRFVIVDNFRQQLSVLLDQYYPKLGRGHLAEFGQAVPEYTLENMRTNLYSRTPVDNCYNEFVSEVLNLDIYILDYTRKIPYITGNDCDILFKGRKSIVLNYIPGHYESVGVKIPPLPTDNLKPGDHRVQTMFDPDHPLIKEIRKYVS